MDEEQNSETVFIYRGVHGEHPAIAAARQGIIFPGNLNGSVTPLEHNTGGLSDQSPFTSWSFDYDVAL